jgi:hypothetical protein
LKVLQPQAGCLVREDEAKLVPEDDPDSLLTDGPMGVGTRWQEVRKFLGKRIETVIELTEYEPNARSAVTMVSGPIPLSGTYAFERVDGGTRFTVTGELDAHGFFKLAEPVFARITGRELESNLGHLKDLLEAGAP